MKKYYLELQELLLWLEFFTAIVALLYLYKLRESYWKWFSIYLVVIFFQEFYWYHSKALLIITKQDYYGFFGIPFQYVFFFWLFAGKSLGRKRLFYGFTFIYLLTLFIEPYFQKLTIVNSINLATGTLFLTFLIILEFLKQIKTDNILKFKENKMFYITLGVAIFYIGTYPLFAFYDVLAQEYINIWNYYFLYFRITNCLMFLLFIASFIWGKHRSS